MTPDPTARETTAAELAEAELIIQHFRIWVSIHRNNPRTGVDVDFELIERAAAELERLRARDEAAKAVVRDALALVDDLLRPWMMSRPVHPGRPAREASFQDVETVEDWWTRRAELDALADQGERAELERLRAGLDRMAIENVGLAVELEQLRAGREVEQQMLRNAAARLAELEPIEQRARQIADGYPAGSAARLARRILGEA